MNKLYLSQHARHRLKQRKISFQKVLDTFDRFSYLFDNMEIGEKRNMKMKNNNKKIIIAVIGKRAENIFFLVTVFTEKKGVLLC